MPGIVGATINSKELLEDMIASIKHEKWYKVDKYNIPIFSIARVHLGIFNPEPQPIFNEDKSLCIFMDGKIYDYEEEMNKLREKHKITIGNEPEFCLHSYEEYGTDFVKNLNGSFVFVICDLKQNKIIIVNDRYGLRPLYYAVNNGKLLFASEVKAILEDKTFKKELNDEAVADFFAFGGVLGCKTFLKCIELLPPASIFTYCDGKFSINQYWDFIYNPDYTLSKEDIIDQLFKSFKKAVKIRLKDNYRYGLSLSGGLDSRLIAAAIDKNMRHNVTACTFGPSNCSEVKIGKKVASKVGIKHKIIELTPENIIENAQDTVYLTDGLGYIGYGHNITEYKVICRYAKVVFRGFELDLILGGAYLNKNILEAKSDKEFFDLMYNKGRIFTDEELSKLFADSYYEGIQNLPRFSLKNALSKVDEKHPGNKHDHFLLRNYSIRNMLMPHLIIRNFMDDLMPAFDNNFVDVILKIPPELRINHRVHLGLLKKLSSELAKIPCNRTMIRADAPLIFWRMSLTLQSIKREIKRRIWEASNGKIFLANKQNFIEFDDWLRTNKIWQRFFTELLLSGNTRSKAYFNQEYIKCLIEEHKAGKGNNSRKLLYIASFEIFLRLLFK